MTDQIRIPVRGVEATPPCSWAEVRAHRSVMRYRRAGAGRAVVVLHQADDAASLWPELFDALAARHRLIVPEMPDGDVDLACWLASFLEGLGSQGVVVVAGAAFGLPALELALVEADRIARLVLVACGRAAYGGLDGMLSAGARPAALPILVVRRGLAAADALAVIGDFVDDAARVVASASVAAGGRGGQEPAR